MCMKDLCFQLQQKDIQGGYSPQDGARRLMWSWTVSHGACLAELIAGTIY